MVKNNSMSIRIKIRFKYIHQPQNAGRGFENHDDHLERHS